METPIQQPLTLIGQNDDCSAFYYLAFDDFTNANCEEATVSQMTDVHPVYFGWKYNYITDDDITAAKRDLRTKAVENIIVTTTAGNSFDGDETSQTRMARAISIMNDTETVGWKLANNTFALVNKAELQEALRLAGQQQTQMWVLYE